MRIFLIGMMGSGKTKIGQRLAKALSYKFIDVDAFIEEKKGKTIPLLFEEIGERKFRELEHQSILDLQEYDDIVVSTGGGLPCFHNNMDLINKNGVSVYLQATPSFLKSRLIHNKSTRPLIANLPDEELENYLITLLELRKPYYEKANIQLSAMNLNEKIVIDKLVKNKILF